MPRRAPPAPRPGRRARTGPAAPACAGGPPAPQRPPRARRRRAHGRGASRPPPHVLSPSRDRGPPASSALPRGAARRSVSTATWAARARAAAAARLSVSCSVSSAAEATAPRRGPASPSARVSAARAPRASARRRPATSAAASSSPARARDACCSACAARRRTCGRSSARMSSTRARFASASASCSSALPAAPLVPPDAGDLLEQRPPLLRPQRERLVHHPLADEQEGVVGEVRRVEQVHEIAQADPLAVQQVLVLARAEQPPPELDAGEIDRQEAVRVVEDERDVGHAERGPASPSRRT